MINVINAPATNSLAQFGIAFGPGTNMFWAKTLNQSLMLVQYDLSSGMGGVIYTAPMSMVPSGFRFISTDSNQKWMAGVMSVASGLPDNVRLYDISAYTNNPILVDKEINTTTNQSAFLNGAGTGPSGPTILLNTNGTATITTETSAQVNAKVKQFLSLRVIRN